MNHDPNIDFRFAPPSSWTCIGFADDQHKSLVREDGALLYDYQRIVTHQFNRILSFRLLGSGEPQTITQVTETAKRPIVITTLTYSHAILQLRAFAYQQNDQRSDIVQWSISQNPNQITPHQVALHLNALQNQGQWQAVDTSDHHLSSFSHIQFSPNTDHPTQPQKDRPVIIQHQSVFSIEQPLHHHPTRTFGPGFGCITEPIALSPDHTLHGSIIITLDHHDAPFHKLADIDHALDSMRQHWDHANFQTRTLQVPDPQINDMLRACARNIFQAREIKDGSPEFQVGPTCYRGLWMVDGHFMLEAARYLGHDQEADRGIDAMLKRVHDDGSITDIPEHTKETGIALATLVRQTELSGNWDRLKKLWPTVIKARHYIQSLRDQARQLDPSAPEFSLLPRSFPDGGINGLRAEYTTALWIMIGLKEAARAAAHLGNHQDADTFQADFQGLLEDFRRCAARDMQHLDNGIPYLPQSMPNSSSEHHWNENQTDRVSINHRIGPLTGTWALCQSIFPGEIFDQDDSIVQNLLRLFEHKDQEQGIPIETGWLPYQALWPYYASFAAHVWLYASQGEKAAQYLYAFANHAAPTRIWREEQSLASSDLDLCWGDMPHNWASAEFIRLVRNLLIFERGNQLELMPGIPSTWLIPNQPIIVENSPTRFGPISITAKLDHANTWHVQAEIDSNWPLQPDTITLHIPSKMNRVIVNNQLAKPDLRTLALNKSMTLQPSSS
ncbi:hypothetical protein [Poriferisphaera sp. WC338]|uniref:hypothetical protein n=1 Tax=Poriferisphaera sp. WC338 TaxID=3425129 RepID=UPI003D8165C0